MTDRLSALGGNQPRNSEHWQWHEQRLARAEMDAEDIKKDVAALKVSVTDLSAQTKKMGDILIRLDIFIRDPEAFEEIRKRHFDQVAIERHSAAREAKTTKIVSVTAAVISCLVGMSVLLKQMVK